MADTTYKSIHKGAQIDSAVTEVLNNLAGIQGVKVDDTELTPDTENKVNIDTTAFNIPAVVQETGTSTATVMSQNAVTTAINAIDIPEVVQQTGTSIETVMSQNAVTNAIGDLVIPTVLQETGISTTDVMSQNAVTTTFQPISAKDTASGYAGLNASGKVGTTAVGTLDTNNATAQAVPETAESFTADIDLHKISKTGTFSDLLSIPTTLSGYGITDGATSTYVDGKVEDSIVDGHTTIAPSGNAVYDALALKLDKTSTGTTRRVYGVDATDLQELTEVETTPTNSSTKLVTSGGVKTALDLKAPLASPTFTGIPTGITQSFTATLPYASWTGTEAPYTKAVTVTGILSTDSPNIDLELSSATYSDVATIQSSWANVYRGVTSADTITFHASTVPTIDIPLGIKVVR